MVEKLKVEAQGKAEALESAWVAIAYLSVSVHTHTVYRQSLRSSRLLAVSLSSYFCFKTFNAMQ